MLHVVRYCGRVCCTLCGSVVAGTDLQSRPVPGDKRPSFAGTISLELDRLDVSIGHSSVGGPGTISSYTLGHVCGTEGRGTESSLY
eukprot:2925259-Rhodomonas_salina.2